MTRPGPFQWTHFHPYLLWSADCARGRFVCRPPIRYAGIVPEQRQATPVRHQYRLRSYVHSARTPLSQSAHALAGLIDGRARGMSGAQRPLNARHCPRRTGTATLAIRLIARDGRRECRRLSDATLTVGGLPQRRQRR